MRKRTGRQITSMLKGYKHISEKIGNAIFILDPQGDIFDVNKTAERLTGYTRNRLLKMNLRQLHPEREQVLSERRLGHISRTKKEVTFESKIIKKNGKTVDVRIIGDRFKFKRENFIIGLMKHTPPNKEPGKPGKEAKRLSSRISSLAHRIGKKNIESMHVLVDVAELRDPYTMRHSMKVTDYAILLANHLRLPKKIIEDMKLATLLHDIGKIGINANVLMKPARLNKQEYREVKQHPLLSVEIVKPFRFMNREIPIIKHHHENYDGTGYPDGLKGEKIPLGARILAIADVYDALTSRRAYRKAYSPREALKIMQRERRKFDPVLLEIFMACMFSKWRAKSRTSQK